MNPPLPPLPPKNLAKPGGGNGMRIPLILLVLFGILRIGLIFYRISNQNSSRHSRYPDTEYPKYTDPQGEYSPEAAERRRKKREEAQRVIDPPPAPVKKDFVISKYNGGGDFSNGLPSYIGTEQKGDTTFIRYEVDIMPTCLSCQKKYVPASLLKPAGKKEQNVVLVFQRQGYQEVMFSHALVINPESGIPSLRATTNAYGQFERVWIKPIAIQKFRYKGFVTLMDLFGRIVKRDTIEMWKKGLHQTEIRYNGQRVAAVDSLTETDKTRGVRLRCALNNLERLNQKSLFPNYENNIKELWIYNFDVGQKDHSDLRDSILLTGWNKVKDAKLTWLFNSNADHMSYFTYADETVDIKYFIEIESGSVEGMQMAKFSKDKNFIERVELFKVQ